MECFASGLDQLDFSNLGSLKSINSRKWDRIMDLDSVAEGAFKKLHSLSPLPLATSTGTTKTTRCITGRLPEATERREGRAAPSRSSSGDEVLQQGRPLLRSPHLRCRRR
ncbi:hypothetical protein RJ640_015098 [Escallonia rubra]|uniref:Uncharacterized protein n=1 Tax=Escallonia rubra TaxID=112253 RepID=A0AA88QUJ2_9ASTE|nr:hypothetical protein RJ640_015098 [Escallonia rubra]